MKIKLKQWLNNSTNMRRKKIEQPSLTSNYWGAVVALIVWYLDLQLPMQSVAISIRARCTTLYDIVCQWLATGRWFSPGPPVSSTNKTDRHDITEILLKVALSTIKQTNQITEHKKRLRQTSLEMHFPTCDAQKIWRS
jgi:hypothetical protein